MALGPGTVVGANGEKQEISFALDMSRPPKMLSFDRDELARKKKALRATRVESVYVQSRRMPRSASAERTTRQNHEVAVESDGTSCRGRLERVATPEGAFGAEAASGASAAEATEVTRLAGYLPA